MLSYGAFNEIVEEANRINKEVVIVVADLMAQLINTEDNHAKIKQQTETTDKIQKYVLKPPASTHREKRKID